METNFKMNIEFYFYLCTVESLFLDSTKNEVFCEFKINAAFVSSSKFLFNNQEVNMQRSLNQ